MLHQPDAGRKRKRVISHSKASAGQHWLHAGTRGTVDFAQNIDQVSCNISAGNASFAVLPISFSIPKEHLVAVSDAWSVKKRPRNFAAIIPGKKSTYTFDTQEEYYHGYQISLFGITFKKAGWDCLRHLEIAANGCMPYMTDVELLPVGTMFRWPKDILKDVLRLKGVDHEAVKSIMSSEIDLPEYMDDAVLVNHKQFNTTLYLSLLHGLHAHLKKYLTTEAMAQYLLSVMEVKKVKNVLFIGSPDAASHIPDYMACTLFHGMRSLLGSQVVDFPKRSWMYTNYEHERSSIYGQGFTYAFLLDDLPVYRDNVLDRLKTGEFSHVVFSVTHNGFDQNLLACVSQHLSQQQVFFIDGSDSGLTDSSPLSADLCLNVGTCFSRELKCLTS